jgi:hypothetical protein
MTAIRSTARSAQDAAVADRPWSADRLLRVLHILLWFSHPAAFVFVFPFRIGAGDLRTAIGLLCTDPSRVRARACALYYVSLALFKAQTLAAILMMFVFPAVGTLNIPWPGWANMLAITFIAAFAIAAILSLLIGIFAVSYALLRRQRVWVDMWVHDKIALDGRWPPVSDTKNNGAGCISLFWPVALAVGTAIAVRYLGIGIIALSLAVCIAPAFWVGYKTLAKTPADCYPEAESRF